jgi:hypothetical protein
MRRAFGPRTAFEAAFLVAVPVVALGVGLGPYAIVAASAVGYLLILVLEAVLWKTGAKWPKLRMRPVSSPAPALAAPALQEQAGAVVVVKREPEPPVAEPVSEPHVEPPPPAPPAVVVEEPAPEPEPVRVLQSVPDPEPEPEPEPEPPAEAPEPGAGEVVPIGVGAAPREWNLWDLERLTREAAGTDTVLDEERTFLLMYLREFAGADGSLPVDFDGLVRDSFGELVGVR